jgi:mRNA interferase HigB
MRVIAVKTIRQFWEKHPDAETGLKHWYERINQATYQNPGAVIADFKKADYVGNTRIVFNIARNKFRLIAAFRYDKQICWIKFVGTHSDYDQIDAPTVEFEP